MHTKGFQIFSDSGKLLRLQPFQNPGILNYFCCWGEHTNPYGMAVIIFLKNLPNKVEAKVRLEIIVSMIMHKNTI